jgi:hypothetical protein
MKPHPKWLLVLLLTLSWGVGFAQDPNPSGPPPQGGWRRFQPTDPPPGPPAEPPADSPADPGPQVAPAGPSRVTLPAGTWITIRLNEPLSSDHNQPGDAFTATLAQPIVADGIAIAHPGQTVTGMVSEAKKAGRVSGTSRLGLQLTQIGLADGRQAQVRSSVMERRGQTSYGRDAAGIGATVATGAAIGAAVNGGVGAGVGAAAGVVASTIGVLLTRGRPTIVYPETPLTFQLDAPLTVDVSNSDAFRLASAQEYQQRLVRRPPPRPRYYGGFYPPYYPYPYPYYYGYGPSLFFSYRGGFRRW